MFAVPLFALTLTTLVTIDGFEFNTTDEVDRYSNLIEEFRCPQCLNTNLAGSDAPVAQDLRRTIYELMLDNRTDQEIRDHLRARYGDFILFNPRVAPGTLILWFAPLVLGLLAIWLILHLHQRRNRVEITEAEIAAVREITQPDRD